jgi:hypothetical protein
LLFAVIGSGVKLRASQKNQKENFEYFAHKIKPKFSIFYSLDKANVVNPATVENFPNNKAVNLNDNGFRLEERRLELLTSCVQGRRSTN